MTTTTAIKFYDLIRSQTLPSGRPVRLRGAIVDFGIDGRLSGAADNSDEAASLSAWSAITN